jgi:hypothetical protein
VFFYFNDGWNRRTLVSLAFAKILQSVWNFEMGKKRLTHSNSSVSFRKFPQNFSKKGKSSFELFNKKENRNSAK